MRRTSSLKRSPLRRTSRKPRKRVKLDPAVRREVVRGGCVVCHDPLSPRAPGPLDARYPEVRRLQWHHLIEQQDLDAHRLGHLVNDARNSVCLCEYHHQRNTNHVQRLPRRLVPLEGEQFARETGLVWLLDREYPR